MALEELPPEWARFEIDDREVESGPGSRREPSGKQWPRGTLSSEPVKIRFERKVFRLKFSIGVRERRVTAAVTQPRENGSGLRARPGLVLLTLAGLRLRPSDVRQKNALRDAHARCAR